MLKSEFIQRTGFHPSDECYENLIEPMYNKSDLTKDEWCANWRRNAAENISNCYNWQLATDKLRMLRAKQQIEWVMKGSDEKTRERLQVAIERLEKDYDYECVKK